jgi:phosphate transport system protein
MSTVRLTYSADRADILDRLRLQHARADRSIVDSMQALLRRDLVLARRVCDADQDVKLVRYGIEEAVTSIIALQQPVASDLRELMSIVPITLNLERIAGHAEGIARIAIFLEDNPVAGAEPDLWRMADVVREMLQSATRSFLERDQHLARQTIDRDDEVDELYSDIHERLIERLAGAEGNPEESDAVTHVIWTSHNLERIGDRALNICERTIFQVTGRFERQHAPENDPD